MPRGIKKENLPTKVCVTCNRPFNWRKKWERCWDEVTTCSKSCNRKRREATRGTGNAVTVNSSNSEDSTESNVLAAQQEEHKVSRNQKTTQVLEPASQSTDADDSMEFDTTSALDLSMLMTEMKDMEPDRASESSSVGRSGAEEEIDPVAQRKAERKAAKKAKKAERRAQREGRGDPSAGQKECDMCHKSVDLLVRCTYDESLKWNMVCGKCWKEASGGVVDGDTSHPYYRYGGLWKNRRAQK